MKVHNAAKSAQSRTYQEMVSFCSMPLAWWSVAVWILACADGVVSNGPANNRVFGAVSGFAPTSKFPKAKSTARSTNMPQEYTHIAQFEYNGVTWTVSEELATRDGDIVFSSSGNTSKTISKSAEAAFYEESPQYPKYLGLRIADVGLDPRDLLAEKLLEKGEPDEQTVKNIIPPQDSAAEFVYGQWSAFIGTVQGGDAYPIFPNGNTRSFQPLQTFPEISANNKKRYEGLLGGWMPATRKVFAISNTEYLEVIVFADVDNKDPLVTQSWHRMSHVKDGKVIKQGYGGTFPTFGLKQKGADPSAFYLALLKFSDYWEKHLSQTSELTTPDPSWADMVTHAFAKELIVRPGGWYPKYGAVDRDYAGTEYDGFQDIFTSSLVTNLELGRFAQAKIVLDNYFTSFVSARGDIKMRGPETAQFGLTLSLLAKYANYTKDVATLEKFKGKIEATAKVLLDLHDESLALPETAPGYGLIHGWSESDACLNAKPETFWQPYYANSAFAVRGLRDISSIPLFASSAPLWLSRASTLQARVITSLTNSPFPNTQPSYYPPLPGTSQTFRASMAASTPSPQQWPHRLYTELLHASILPSDLSNALIATLQSYGGMSLGMVQNVGLPYPESRDLLGFISYGYAYALLLHDRVDEFILFLYTHRYHVHSRGAWVASEVAGIAGGRGTFCIPAQLTIPILLKWMMVLESPDAEKIEFGKGVPRAWLATGKEISISNASTRWGGVDFSIRWVKEKRVVEARVEWRDVGGPGVEGLRVELRVRVPRGWRVGKGTVSEGPADGSVSGDTMVMGVNSGSRVLSYTVEVSPTGDGANGTVPALVM
ncbi:hypothetical protein K402DRAFT_121927 [Aulographum hederae CBS 113979]|uniref:Uncharacterized protein n=1 Tax=Aulographum hederae CBS 113979 TaxID=1176131 RepID=A0A6G1GVV8_9PEZI|nr:hypothetical protein K402DRAFT_121927 [Aulographum hederae CBS 113979]